MSLDRLRQLLPGEEGTNEKVLRYFICQNLALTVVYVPYSLNGGPADLDAENEVDVLPAACLGKVFVESHARSARSNGHLSQADHLIGVVVRERAVLGSDMSYCQYSRHVCTLTETVSQQRR